MFWMPLLSSHHQSNDSNQWYLVQQYSTVQYSTVQYSTVHTPFFPSKINCFLPPAYLSPSLSLSLTCAFYYSTFSSVWKGPSSRGKRKEERSETNNTCLQ